jgi:hypothetical protein
LVHQVGNDVRILGLSLRRPNTEHAFRMLCRHNMYVQNFGRVRDPDEIARREVVWETMCTALEHKTGHEVGVIPAAEFRRLVAEEIVLDTFHPSAVRPYTPKPRQRAPKRSAASAYDSARKDETNKRRGSSPRGLTVIK